MDNVEQIHPELIREYNRAYGDACRYAMGAFGRLDIPALRRERMRLDVFPGFLSVRDRAWRCGQLEVIGELIGSASLEDPAQSGGEA